MFGRNTRNENSCFSFWFIYALCTVEWERMLLSPEYVCRFHFCRCPKTIPNTQCRLQCTTYCNSSVIRSTIEVWKSSFASGLQHHRSRKLCKHQPLYAMYDCFFFKVNLAFFYSFSLLFCNSETHFVLASL